MIDFYATPSADYVKSDHYKKLSLELKEIEEKLTYLNFLWVNHWHNVSILPEPRMKSVERLFKRFYSRQDCLQRLIQKEVILN